MMMHLQVVVFNPPTNLVNPNVVGRLPLSPIPIQPAPVPIPIQPARPPVLHPVGSPLPPVQSPLPPVQSPLPPVQSPFQPPSIKRISTMIPDYTHQEYSPANRSLGLLTSGACETACINDKQCAMWNFLPPMQNNSGFDRCLLYYGKPGFIGPARSGAYGRIYNQLPV